MAQLTYTDDNGSFRFDLAPAVFSALTQLVAEERVVQIVDGVAVQVPKYQHIAQMLFGHFTGLFNSALEKHPSEELITAFAEKFAAEAKIKQLQETIVSVSAPEEALVDAPGELR